MSARGSIINISGCSSLSELPEEICKYTMLTSIQLSSCTNLKTLPSRFRELTCLQHLDLTGCGSLQELCNDFHCLRGLRKLVLNGCKSLSRLPLGFGKLSSLETLGLSGCDKLEELCSDFHCLGGLRELDLKCCKSLSRLPLDFGKLSSLETLDLSACDKLEELCSNFHCLVALNYLDLSKCHSLRNLPDHFGELGCLKSLDLSECSSLERLSDDFHFLKSLIRVDLSKCKSLGGEWMDKVGNIRSLRRLDIVGSERMIQRWMETKSLKEGNFIVKTDFHQDEEALLFEGVLSKVFDEEGILVDADERPFHSSLLQPQTPIIFIIDQKYNWSRGLGKDLKLVQNILKESQIIYVGSQFKLLSSQLAIRILAHTPDNSSFYHTLSAIFYTEATVIFRSSDQLEENGLKCLSAWEDISYILTDRVVDFLTKNPRESNIELLKELLVTEETDYLLLNKNPQVKVVDLQGKLILLLVSNLRETLEVRTIAAVKEMYVKMQERHNYVVELVWVPIPGDSTWEEFKRAAANAPWPVVPNPRLIDTWRISDIDGTLPCVCVVDEKGRISNRNAIRVIERWGLEAYPFSQDREEELRKAEWEGFKFNSLSTLQFNFQNLELLSNKGKEMMDRGVMMLKLAPDLNCAFTMLEKDFLVFYVAHRGIYANANAYDSTATLSFYNIPNFLSYDFFWQDHLKGMGTAERIVELRRRVLNRISDKEKTWNSCEERQVSIVLVDGNGEMVSGRGMEVVEVVCDGEEDSKEKLEEDMKKEGVEKSAESRWRDGIIYREHYNYAHLLLKLDNLQNIICSLCDKERYTVYQCNECEEYVICEECVKGVKE